jgi:hypothetical protein
MTVRDETVEAKTLLVDELANELRHYRHSPMASSALAEHILAIPRIYDALAKSQQGTDEVTEALPTPSECPFCGPSIAGFLETILECTPNGEYILVQYHPNGDWTVARTAMREAKSGGGGE